MLFSCLGSDLKRNLLIFIEFSIFSKNQGIPLILALLLVPSPEIPVLARDSRSFVEGTHFQ